MWELPVSCYLPHSNRLVERFILRQLMMGMRIASETGRAYHIVLDVPRLRLQLASAQKGLEKLFNFAALIRQQKGIQLVRLADVDRRVQLATMARPARSILRVA
jgi:hypothetical protein